MEFVQGKVDIIIPTYKPDERFVRLIELLERQSYQVANIYVINTERDYWDKLMQANKLEERFLNLTVKHISVHEFDHGGTRHMAVDMSDAEFFVCMTQDALPYDEYLIEKLLAPMSDNENIAATYARQLPNSDAAVTEKYVRQFNYPEKSYVKNKASLATLGIKTYFCSNVCAAYRRSTYEKLGGFILKTIFNEDMIYAAAAIKGGCSIGYAADAKVYHSHNYSGKQQFHRNFDLAVSQAQHPEIFEGVKSESEGMKLVKDMRAYLASIHKSYLMPGFIINCGCRYLGYRLGKNYKKLPRFLIKKITSNKAYWD